jgi:hypothetical protein
MLSNLVKVLRISEAQINFELNFELIQKENMKDNCSNGPLLPWSLGGNRGGEVVVTGRRRRPISVIPGGGVGREQRLERHG